LSDNECVCMYVESRELLLYVQCSGEMCPASAGHSIAFRILEFNPHSSIFLLLPFGAGSSGVRE
jgi:hypothetical protein